MKYIKDNWKFLLIVLIICLIGGYFTLMYEFQSFDQKMLDEVIKQVGSKNMFIVLSMISILFYTIIFSIFGIILSNKVGLWKKIKKDNEGIRLVCIISIIGGLLISVFDRYLFGLFIEQIKHLYDVKPTIEYIIASFTYGAVFEEILIRLFLMSLFVFIISKIFNRKNKKIPVKVFVIANILSALLFALGHIPSTIQIFGYIDCLLLFRCILLNAGLGLLLGYLYRKYGICYSMFAHFGIHFISKLLWILFI